MRTALSYIEYLVVVGLWWLYRLMPVRWAYRMGLDGSCAFGGG